MAELYLVRHGQASFGSDNYDQLSPLGYQQALWLGEYLRDRAIHPDRMIIGDMARHRQTAENICQGLGRDMEIEVHAGFNEFDFLQLVNAYIEQRPELDMPDKAEPKQVYRLLRTAMTAWSKNEIDESSLTESWQEFHSRVEAALSFARRANTPRTLVASSGGTIAVALSQIMGFDSETLINVNLQSKNTGVSHFHYNDKNIYVSSFNNVPHLDSNQRLDAITYS
ncbi:MAG: histidine phosphatase family protein [Pseudomonadales bacterium]